MKVSVGIGALLCTVLALAQEQPPRLTISAAAPPTNATVTDLVVTLTACASLHAAAAELLERENLPQHAQNARRRAQLDQYSAMYLLAQDHIAKSGTPRPLESYLPYVETLTATSKNRMLALLASDDAASFEREERICESLRPLQDEILPHLHAE